MKHKLLFFMAFFLPCLVFAQGNVSVKGSVIGAVSNDPIPGVIVTVTELNRQVTTDADGNFTIRNIQPGTYVIQLNSVMITPKNVSIEVENLGVTELKPIRVTELNANEDVSMIGIIDAGMVDDDVETSGQDVSSTVILSNDIFLVSFHPHASLHVDTTARRRLNTSMAWNSTTRTEVYSTMQR